MTYENEFTSMSIRVPKSFRESFTKPEVFWKDLGDVFMEMSKHVPKADINQIRIDNPQVFTFIEEVLPE